MLRVLVLLTLLSPATVRAEDLMAQEARAHYLLGKVAFDRGDFQRALDEFGSAYRIASIPDLLYNIGSCQEKLRDFAAATESYQKYLRAKPNAEEAAELSRHIAELEQATPPKPEPPKPEPKPAVQIDLTARPTPGPVVEKPATTPIYRRWWLWTTVAVVVVGLAVLLAYGLTSSAGPPGLSFPPVRVQ